MRRFAFVLITVLAAGATAHGSEHPANVQWEEFLPALSSPTEIQPRSVPNCRKATIRCIDVEIRRLRERQRKWGCDHRAVFATTYLELTKELRQLLRDTDRTMLAVGRQAESTLSILSRVGTQTEQQLPILAGKLATTLDSLDATSKQVRETTRTNGEALRELLTQAPELMRGSGELVRDTQELTTAARRTWLLRDYIEPSEMRTLPVDSFESFGKR